LTDVDSAGSQDIINAADIDSTISSTVTGELTDVDSAGSQDIINAADIDSTISSTVTGELTDAGPAEASAQTDDSAIDDRLSELFGEARPSPGRSGGEEALIFDAGDGGDSRAQAASDAPALVVDESEAAAMAAPVSADDPVELIADEEFGADERDEINRLNALFGGAAAASAAEEDLIIDEAGSTGDLFDFNAVETMQIDSSEISRAMEEAKTAAEPAAGIPPGTGESPSPQSGLGAVDNIEAATSGVKQADDSAATPTNKNEVTGDDIENRLNELFPNASEPEDAVAAPPAAPKPDYDESDEVNGSDIEKRLTELFGKGGQTDGTAESAAVDMPDTSAGGADQQPDILDLESLKNDVLPIEAVEHMGDAGDTGMVTDNAGDISNINENIVNIDTANTVGDINIASETSPANDIINTNSIGDTGNITDINAVSNTGDTVDGINNIGDTGNIIDNNITDINAVNNTGNTVDGNINNIGDTGDIAKTNGAADVNIAEGTDSIITTEPVPGLQAGDWQNLSADDVQEKIRQLNDKQAEPADAGLGGAFVDAGVESELDERDTPFDLPDHVLTSTLADIYYQQGQPQLALHIYERLALRDPDDPQLMAKIEEIRDVLMQTDPGGGAAPPSPPQKASSVEKPGGASPGRKKKGAEPKTKRDRRPLAGVRIKKKDSGPKKGGGRGKPET
jgi:hypothetical protein